MSDLKYERSGHVPVIDMNKSDEELSVEFYEALTTVGFACICNSGIWELVTDNRYRICARMCYSML